MRRWQKSPGGVKATQERPRKSHFPLCCPTSSNLRRSERGWVRVLGFEASERCVDYAAAAVHVVQHLRFHERVYGEFYLAPPKAGSVGTVDLDDQDSAVLAEHAFKYRPRRSCCRTSREAPRSGQGTAEAGCRTAVHGSLISGGPDVGALRQAAGWPQEGTSLRHYFATLLIASGADPTDVQRAIHHSSLRITLETYVHRWPTKQRRSSSVGPLAWLRPHVDRHSPPRKIHAELYPRCTN